MDARQPMALTIDDPEVERLAAEVAERTGETPAGVAARLLRQSLQPKTTASRRPRPSEVFAAARQRLAAIPNRDPRSAEDIIGYDERGLPA
jgi:antitoxin VapB